MTLQLETWLANREYKSDPKHEGVRSTHRGVLKYFVLLYTRYVRAVDVPEACRQAWELEFPD